MGGCQCLGSPARVSSITLGASPGARTVPLLQRDMQAIVHEGLEDVLLDALVALTVERTDRQAARRRLLVIIARSEYGNPVLASEWMMSELSRIARNVRRHRAQRRDQ